MAAAPPGAPTQLCARLPRPDALEGRDKIPALHPRALPLSIRPLLSPPLGRHDRELELELAVAPASLPLS